MTDSGSKNTDPINNTLDTSIEASKEHHRDFKRKKKVSKKKITNETIQNTDNVTPLSNTKPQSASSASSSSSSSSSSSIHYNTTNFTPKILTNPRSDTLIVEYRNKNMVVAEGTIWKRRKIFKCFWHQKYFVLLNNGLLVYHKLDGSRFAKGNFDMLSRSIEKQVVLNEVHPYRILIIGDIYLAFDTEIERDYWYDKIIELKQKLQNK